MSELVTVCAVGDLMPGESAICVGYGFGSSAPATPLDAALGEVVPLLRSADVAIGNLETPISHAGLRPRSWASRQMRGSPGHAAELARAGFGVLSVANNHAVQHGLAAFRDTVALVGDAGILVCGLRGTDGWASQPVTFEARGHTVGVLGYSLRPRQYSTEEPPYAEGPGERIVADVSRLADVADSVLVSLHWGEEFVDRPSRSEVELAHRIVDAGAAAVLGHHPHVLRPVETYGGGVIAYSLGNLLCDMVWQEPLRWGGVLELELSPGGARAVRLTETRIDDGFRPAIVRSGAVEAARPVPALEDGVYARQVARTVAEQRSAAYGYAARNVHRYPPDILAQFVGRTLYNKLSGILTCGRAAD